MRKLMQHFQAVLQEDAAPQAEGAAIHLRKGATVRGRTVETEGGGSHFAEGWVAPKGKLPLLTQPAKSARDPIAHGAPKSEGEARKWGPKRSPEPKGGGLTGSQMVFAPKSGGEALK